MCVCWLGGLHKLQSKYCDIHWSSCYLYSFIISFFFLILLFDLSLFSTTNLIDNISRKEHVIVLLKEHMIFPVIVLCFRNAQLCFGGIRKPTFSMTQGLIVVFSKW